MSAEETSAIRERLEALSRLRVVLISTKFPGNLGMAARAMMNCGVSDLRLVSPRAEINKEAYLLATSATEILDDAKVHDSLLEAVADCGLVVGTSRRRGSSRKNPLSPEQAAELIRTSIQANPIAVVFGAEDNGIPNRDLELCHGIVSMTTGAESQSFNLANSVAIILYLINRAVIADPHGPKRLAAAIDQEMMFADLSNYLVEIGFIQEQDPRRMMLLFRSLLHRAGLSPHEVRTIRGALRQARWRMKNPDAEIVPRGAPIPLKKEFLRKVKAGKKRK